MHQELDVSVSARDRRRDPRMNLAAVVDKTICDLSLDPVVDRRIGDDPAPLAYIRATGLELWLHEQHHGGLRLAHGHQRRDDQRQ
jgi:hypothetical protein